MPRFIRFNQAFMVLHKQLISFSQTNTVSQIILDYLAGDPKLRSFYNYTPDLTSFEEKIKSRLEQTVNREVLFNCMVRQYEYLTDFDSSKLNILRDKNTFTVTTGHQLNLFTGPLYFIYKICSTIKLSQQLKQAFPKYNFVPVYWMASEDHDFEEINHAHVFDTTINWNIESKGPCGRLNPETISVCIDQLEQKITDTEYGEELISLFRHSYLENKTLANAMRQLVNYLFGHYGLLIVDADDGTLKKEFSNILSDEINHQHSYQLVNRTTEALNEYYKTQMAPRPVNLFYMEEKLRVRLIKENSHWTTPENEFEFSQEQLLQTSIENPQLLSPNVVLRPLYQETILPNLAYVGGGAEIAYWLQLKSMFDYYKTDLPVLMVRDSILLLDEPVRKRMQKLALTNEDLFKPENVLTHELISRADNYFNPEVQIETLNNVFDSISEQLKELDRTLVPVVEAERKKMIQSMELLKSKAGKALKRNHEQQLNQLAFIKQKVSPSNQLQERHYNFSMYYCKYGRNFTDTLIEQINPFEKELKIFSVE